MGATVERPFGVILGGDTRQHHDRRLDPEFADALGQRGAIHRGHEVVEDNRVEGRIVEHGERLGRAARQLHVEASGPKHITHHLAGTAGVVDDEHPRRGGGAWCAIHPGALGQACGIAEDDDVPAAEQRRAGDRLGALAGRSSP